MVGRIVNRRRFETRVGDRRSGPDPVIMRMIVYGSGWRSGWALRRGPMGQRHAERREEEGQNAENDGQSLRHLCLPPDP